MIKINNSNIGSVYYGDNPIGKIFKGSDLVFDHIIPETDIALYDNVQNKEITVPTSKFNITDYPANRYTPVGIVVIPANISE